MVLLLLSLLQLLLSLLQLLLQLMLVVLVALLVSCYLEPYCLAACCASLQLSSSHPCVKHCCFNHSVGIAARCCTFNQTLSGPDSVGEESGVTYMGCREANRCWLQQSGLLCREQTMHTPATYLEHAAALPAWQQPATPLAAFRPWAYRHCCRGPSLPYTPFFSCRCKWG